MLNQYDDVLSVEDICEILYIGRNTAYKMLNEGKIVAVRCGKSWRISKQALISYLNCGHLYSQFTTQGSDPGKNRLPYNHLVNSPHLV